MNIEMPCNFNLYSSMKFCNTIDRVENDDNYVYDYKNMSTVEPFGMLIIASKIRGFLNKADSAKHFDSNYKGNGYAAHMGFFQSIYQDYGNKPGEAKGSNTYVPITCVNLKQSYVEAFEQCKQIYDYIEESIAKSLARVLARGNNNMEHCLTYCFTELIRNVYEHSESKELWYAGQYWPTKDLVEVAILDEGKGIKKSIERNKRITACDDYEAIKLALEPGISRNVVRKDKNDIYSNSGFGLYMTSTMCCGSGGSFVVCSGSKCLEINNRETKIIDTSFMGTAIRMRIRPSKITQIDNKLSNLSKMGSEKSKKINLLNKISINSLEEL